MIKDHVHFDKDQFQRYDPANGPWNQVYATLRPVEGSESISFHGVLQVVKSGVVPPILRLSLRVRKCEGGDEGAPWVGEKLVLWSGTLNTQFEFHHQTPDPIPLAELGIEPGHDYQFEWSISPTPSDPFTAQVHIFQMGIKWNRSAEVHKIDDL